MRDNSFVAVILMLALLYIISPIDLVPDVIPIVGWADESESESEKDLLHWNRGAGRRCT